VECELTPHIMILLYFGIFIIQYFKKKVFLGKEWNFFHLLGNKLDYLHLKDFLKYECELYLKQPLTPSQHKIIVSYCISIMDLSLTLDDGQLSYLEIKDYATFACKMCLK